MRHIKLIGVLALVIGIILIGLAYAGLEQNKEANTCSDATFAIQVMEQQLSQQATCERYQASNVKRINEDILQEARNARLQGDCGRAVQLTRSIDTSLMCNVIMATPSAMPAELDVSWIVIGVMFVLSIVLVMIVALLHHHK